jgi:hypothetical protein
MTHRDIRDREGKARKKQRANKGTRKVKKKETLMQNSKIVKKRQRYRKRRERAM